MIARQASLAAFSLALLLFAAPAFATDSDGPDCGRAIEDFGDAPEGPTDYPVEGIAAYPTCLAPGPVGNVQNVVPIRGTPPGPAGYVRHVQSGSSNYWIGCHTLPGGIAGIDSETNGKYSPGIGLAGCGSGPLPDCSDYYGQDECTIGTDAGVGGVLFVCRADPYAVFFNTGNCGGERTAYLNVLADINNDGDWNDNLPCRAASYGCFGDCSSPDNAAHEWAVKNVPITIPSGCASHDTPRFETGPEFLAGVIWLRLSLTDEPVADDFPWNGGSYTGGETEDHLMMVTTPDGARKSTWGELKIRYR